MVEKKIGGNQETYREKKELIYELAYIINIILKKSLEGFKKIDTDQSIDNKHQTKIDFIKKEFELEIDKIIKNVNSDQKQKIEKFIKEINQIIGLIIEKNKIDRKIIENEENIKILIRAKNETSGTKYSFYVPLSQRKTNKKVDKNCSEFSDRVTRIKISKETELKKLQEENIKNIIKKLTEVFDFEVDNEKKIKLFEIFVGK